MTDEQIPSARRIAFDEGDDDTWIECGTSDQFRIYIEGKEVVRCDVDGSVSFDWPAIFDREAAGPSADRHGWLLARMLCEARNADR